MRNAFHKLMKLGFRFLNTNDVSFLPMHPPYETFIGRRPYAIGIDTYDAHLSIEFIAFIGLEHQQVFTREDTVAVLGSEGQSDEYDWDKKLFWPLHRSAH